MAPKTATVKAPHEARPDAKTLPAKPVGDQKAAPAGDKKPGDQKSGAKKKGASGTVVRWKRLNELKACVTGKIAFAEGVNASDKNPKRSRENNGAKERFALYRSGMTVPEYVAEVTKDGVKLNTQAGCLSDVRWDVAAGWITLDGKDYYAITGESRPVAK